jgi:hypothetical protein
MASPRSGGHHRHLAGDLDAEDIGDQCSEVD